MLRVEEGSLYPALYRLEEQGLIESEWRATENNRKAKFYTPTRKGAPAGAGRDEGGRRPSTRPGSVSPRRLRECFAPSNREHDHGVSSASIHPPPARALHVALARQRHAAGDGVSRRRAGARVRTRRHGRR